MRLINYTTFKKGYKASNLTSNLKGVYIMGKIIILDEKTANKIAAGEVVERPSSVVKELVENSIDAGASFICVEIRDGGISMIKATDNGCGIAHDDVELAFERHATSKIKNENDLNNICTLGFRGEALASIASVSKVQLVTRQPGDAEGCLIEVEGGKVVNFRETGCPSGTTITIKDLFYNTPARYKFLKSNSTEASYVAEILTKIALGRPDVSFKFINSGKTIFHTPGNGDLTSCIYSLYGKEFASNIINVSYKNTFAEIKGVVGTHEISKKNRNYQNFYINGRYIRSKLITEALEKAYETMLMKHRFPAAVLNININPSMIDVNVHPAKLEVRFSNEQDIFRTVYDAVSSAFYMFASDKNVAESFNYNFLKSISSTVNIDKKVNYDEEQTQFLLISDDNINDSHQTNVNNISDDRCISDKPDIKTIKDKIISNTEEYNNTEQQTIYKKLDNYVIGGEVFSTYIILYNDFEMLLLDQHAAHERIIYEDIKARFEKGDPMSQYLMSPEVLELDIFQYQCSKNYKQFLERLGFNFENFGNNSIVIRAVPAEISNADVAVQTFKDALDMLMKEGKIDEAKTKDALFTIACKAAVKAKQKLKSEEIKSLIEQLLKLEKPFTCPHGRPIAIRFSKYEIERKIKRIL